MSQEQSREDFYQALRARITAWLSSKGKGFRHARLLLLAPDLFHLLTRLMLDSRIPAADKRRLPRGRRGRGEGHEHQERG